MKLPYQDRNLPSPERTADLLARLSLAEKIAQLRNLVVNSPADARMENGRAVIGEELARVLAGDGVGSLQCLSRCDFWTTRNQGYDRAGCAAISDAVQRFAVEHSRWGIPLLLFDDCRHGMPGVDATVFPAGIAQAAAWDRGLSRRIARAVAVEMRDVGTTVSVGPNLNLARDPRWSRVEETYGEDPYLAGELGAAYVAGLQQTDAGGTLEAAACMHFLGPMGDAENGIDGRPVPIGPRTLAGLFRPFGKSARAGARAAMASYSSIDGVPCHANRHLLTTLLREEYGFDGLVESDAIGVFALKSQHAMSGDEAVCAAMALNAGLNVDLYCDGLQRYTLANVERAMALGLLTLETIDRLTAEVLKLKFDLGLFENHRARFDGAPPHRHRETALEAARRSLTLLKNDGLLPLDPDRPRGVAVIGPHADDIYNLLGDYTPFVDPAFVSTPYRGFQAVAPAGWRISHARGCNIKTADPELFAAALAAARQADCIVMTLGGSSNRYGQEFNAVGGGSGGAAGDADCGEGYDRATLELYPAQLELWHALGELGKPRIAVLIHGRAMCFGEILRTADAVIDQWYPGEAGGQALAEAVFGFLNPAGRLPLSLPRHAGQLPVYYNSPRPDRALGHGYLDLESTPELPFGFGLSYTRFGYTGLKVTPALIAPDGEATVSVEVTNLGDRPGDEIVQLYLSDEFSLCARPERELAGFERIHLEPGETRRVEFTVGFEVLSYAGPDCRRVVEPGVFHLSMGGLTAELRVE